MIYIKDNFLDSEKFNALQIELASNEYKTVSQGGKDFHIQNAHPEFIKHVEQLLEDVENKKVKSILSFFRLANKDKDNEWRIHADNVINNQLPDRAIVLYMSKPSNGLNGTAFWSHYSEGYKLDDIKNFNKILIDDTNDAYKWNLESIVGHKENRIVSYPCNYFHSKYPDKHVSEREVFVMFYKTYEKSKTK
jgi:hypothetical protein